MNSNTALPVQKMSRRRGAVLPLFALLLPVLFVLCAFAINLANMQLRSTEVKIATDASAHAAGRAMSIHQTTQAAFDIAESTLDQNLGSTSYSYSVGESGSGADLEIGFGTTSRSGSGRHEFNPVARAAIDSGQTRATSISVQMAMNLAHIFPFMDSTDFSVSRRSVATQVDRDIALVLDRSGSMLWYQDETALTNALWELYNTYESESGYWVYHYYAWRRGRWRSMGYWQSPQSSSWVNFNSSDRYWVNGGSERLISYTEYQNATDWLYYRSYSDNVIYQLEKRTNASHTLGDSYSSSERYKLYDEMALYCHDWEYETHRAPNFSRWYFLDLGVIAFLDVLDQTDQEERVSLTTFSSSTSLDLALQHPYSTIITEIEDVRPYGGTAIGDGMNTALPSILTGSGARPFAAKTIVVMTDGDSNTGVDPKTAAQDIIADNDVVIHTVTFTKGANQYDMDVVATYGNGKHYHADEGEDLVAVFEEIANNLPTILTE
ncbi:MAG: VWA domain-containing protein [Planctomycetota bacterium]